jgi:hypothetical protein
LEKVAVLEEQGAGSRKEEAGSANADEMTKRLPKLNENQLAVMA